MLLYLFIALILFSFNTQYNIVNNHKYHIDICCKTLICIYFIYIFLNFNSNNENFDNLNNTCNQTICDKIKDFYKSNNIHSNTNNILECKNCSFDDWSLPVQQPSVQQPLVQQPLVQQLPVQQLPVQQQKQNNQKKL